MRVDSDTVRRGELARRNPGMRLAEPRDHLVALCRMDADARPDIRPVPVDFALRPAFADIAKRVGTARQAHTIWPVQVIPPRLPFAVAIEDLDAMVFAVSDVDPAVGIA